MLLRLPPAKSESPADTVSSGTARPKRTDLDLSKVFVGTCPDMCPEKERYMRETRNQLSSFEVIANTEKVSPPLTLMLSPPCRGLMGHRQQISLCSPCRWTTLLPLRSTVGPLLTRRSPFPMSCGPCLCST